MSLTGTILSKTTCHWSLRSESLPVTVWNNGAFRLSMNYSFTANKKNIEFNIDDVKIITNTHLKKEKLEFHSYGGTVKLRCKHIFWLKEGRNSFYSFFSSNTLLRYCSCWWWSPYAFVELQKIENLVCIFAQPNEGRRPNTRTQSRWIFIFRKILIFEKLLASWCTDATILL